MPEKSKMVRSKITFEIGLPEKFTTKNVRSLMEKKFKNANYNIIRIENSIVNTKALSKKTKINKKRVNLTTENAPLIKRYLKNACQEFQEKALTIFADNDPDYWILEKLERAKAEFLSELDY